jgi:hypothetical protein
VPLEEIPIADNKWLDRDLPFDQASFGRLWDKFFLRYRERINPEHRVVCEKFIAAFDRYVLDQNTSDAVRSVVHGDFRLDNMVFGKQGGGKTFTIVDWRTVSWGPVMSDLSYFLGAALTIEDRRKHEAELIDLYHHSLGSRNKMTKGQCLEGIKRQSFLGLITCIHAPMVLERNPRGDDLFMAMLARHCTHVLDTGALDIIPTLPKLPPLQPLPSDEGVHYLGPDFLWNESWYFDCNDEVQGLGLWVRLGLTPNQKGSWYTALICGPGRPTVAVVDMDSPHPTPFSSLEVKHDKFNATHVCEEPLQKFRVTLNGKGESHDEPATLLAGRPGNEVDVKIDLVWHTVGVPYKYRIITRYEIPCTVSGSLTIDGVETSFTAVPGQRDHSWGGIRSWWDSDWIWSAWHLDDGTHIHAVELRPQGKSKVGVGYIQGANQEFIELNNVVGVEKMEENGMAISTVITCTNEKIPGGKLVLDIKRIGHAPLRLVDKITKEVAMFPRCWSHVTTNDGRQGTGWIEWNLVNGFQDGVRTTARK